jgi:hypothetical protein
MTRYNDDDNDDILRDGETLRTSMLARDSRSRHSDASTFDAASHRPGFRFSSNTADAKQKLYDDVDRELNEAWRNSRNPTTTSRAPPSGSYPEGINTRAGDACTFNGAPGTLVKIPNHDGWLECRPTSTDSADSRRTHQQTMDELYRQYDAELASGRGR